MPLKEDPLQDPLVRPVAFLAVGIFLVVALILAWPYILGNLL